MFLAKAEDASRIVQKFLLGKGDPSDMLALTATVDIWSGIQQRVNQEREMEYLERRSFSASEWVSLDTLMNRMVNLEDLAQRISLAVERPVSPQYDELAEDADLESDENSGTLRAEWRYGRVKFGIKIKPECVKPLFIVAVNI